MSADDSKRAVGEAAAELAQPGMIVGLGTGSTAAWFVRALATRGLDIRCVPTSEATAALAREGGLALIALDEAREIDLTVDGADEIGPGLALIKGAGGALLREKLVWEASRRCVVIADSSKLVRVLGAGRYPLPIEVIAFGHEHTLRRIEAGLADCGILAQPRLRRRDDGAVVLTDSGNLIYDAPCGAILDPPGVEAALKSITGVVEHGLFLGLAREALIGTAAGVERLSPRDLMEPPYG
ncbi:MAG TPA: ribose-5-phosphate isomerase RpiA [Caulobacteraceae bacterium]|nr:ribose-5-phosphate isomerase RpiA [Caulobacteraceae bacterium]